MFILCWGEFRAALLNFIALQKKSLNLDKSLHVDKMALWQKLPHMGTKLPPFLPISVEVKNMGGLLFLQWSAKAFSAWGLLWLCGKR